MLQQDFSVHHRVVRDATGKAEIRYPRLLVHMIEHVKRDLFEAQLQTRRDVALAIGQRGSGLARGAERAAQTRRKRSGQSPATRAPRHLNAFRVMPEVIQIQSKLPALFRANDLAKLVDKARLAIRREAHHLSLIAVMRKPEKLRRRGVDDPGRVRILNLAQHLDRVPFANAPTWSR